MNYMQHSNKKLFLPKRLGMAADLCFSVPDHVGYLADCLLVHDTVVVPLSAETLNRLEAAFDSPLLFELIKEQKIVFCKNNSYKIREICEDKKFDRECFIHEVRKFDLFKSDADRPALFAEITKSFVDPVLGKNGALVEVRNKIDASFAHYASLPGYEYLFPRDVGILAPGHFYYQVGAMTGVGRINDLVSSGIDYMEMDRELPFLLELCFPIKREAEVDEKAFRSNSQKIISDLHKIKNIPSFEIKKYQSIMRPVDEVRQIVKLVLSDEAQDLREWLYLNIAEDLDVRASYEHSEKLLPSKSQWSGWMRFGATTGLGALAGLLLPDPIAGVIAGTGVGVVDKLWGSKPVEQLDTYHPKIWLAQMSKFMPNSLI